MLTFDRNADGYRIGEFLDSDVQPVFLMYRERNGDYVALIEGEWSEDTVVEALRGRPNPADPEGE